MNRDLFWIFVICWLIFASSAYVVCAETITLQDGRVIQGQLTRQPSGLFLVQPDEGASFSIPTSDIVKIAMGAPKDPQQIAVDQWEYTQFIISQQTNLATIISSIQDYLQKYPDSPNAKDAAALLSQFQKYQTDGYVKFGDKWVTPVERGDLANQVQTLVDGAIQSIHTSAPVQAMDQAQKILAIDPDNMDAMILAGVSEYSLGRQQDALTWFNKVLKSDPQNVIALNDAAVTSFAVNVQFQPRALACYQTALNLASGNRMLLDNVAAALNDFQGDTSGFLYKNLLNSFNGADQQMQAIMSQQGLYRFGGSWVSAEQKSQLEAKSEAYKQEKTTLQANYDIALVVLQGIDEQLGIVNRQISLLNESVTSLQSQINNGQNYNYYFGPYGWYYDNTGGNVALLNQYLSELNQAQQLQVQLRTQQIQYQAQVKNIQDAAQQFIQQGDALGYNGIQVMMLPGDLQNVPPPLPLTSPGQVLNPQAGNGAAN
ncbi:MAG TPA: hypothetical protein VMG59_13035 [Phycisphaerae bacterium]|nr:hypothetical protein [Phycisphaerae bacterium]